MIRAIAILPLLLPLAALAADPPETRPKVAFFPLGGNAADDLRDKVGFSLRAKLDRTGKYDVIDGPKMKEIASEAKTPISLSTSPDILKDLNKLLSADVLVWGDCVNAPQGTTVRLKLLDLRQGASAAPRELSKVIRQPTDLRFVAEEILETLPNVTKFQHVPEESVVNDATADKMWATQPNLVKNWDFSKAGGWSGIYMSEYYDVSISDKPAPVDKVVIWRMPDGNNVLSMNLSRTCAENNGLACLSERIEIAPDTRYRLSFRYNSAGPTHHVFVKGYTMFDNINGEKVPREIYRRQVPPMASTKGQWVTIVDDLNPQHVAFPVQFLKIDLYAYLSPGQVMFDDIILKPVGKQTRKGADPAIKKPVTQPMTR